MKTFVLSIVIIFFSGCIENRKDSGKSSDKNNNTVTSGDEDSILGFYTALLDSNNNDDCKLSVKLSKNNNCYNYLLKTNKRNIYGAVTLGTNESGERYVILENIPWAEYQGDTSIDEEIVKTQEIELPKEIIFLYQKDTLRTQNYGNSHNYYIKIGECGAKFIQLVKNKIPNSSS